MLLAYPEKRTGQLIGQFSQEDPMFHAARLPEGATTTRPAPREPREIHIFIDRSAMKLRIEPRGTLERAAADEIIGTLGFPLTGGAADVVATAAAICERFGWTPVARWLDDANDLHVRMVKDGPRG